MTIKEKIMRIMELALEIDPPEMKCIGEERTAVFVDWSPHCNSLCVSVHFGGWRPGRKPDERFGIYTYRQGDELDMIIAELERIRAELPGGEK